MTQREKEVVELLLQGCDTAEIAKELKMAKRTVKAHFNRLFLRFGITNGIKRVKLATLMYRNQRDGLMEDKSVPSGFLCVHASNSELSSGQL